MGTENTDRAAAVNRRAKDRIISPIARQLRLAGWISILAGALWPVQAGAIAWAVSGWATGNSPVYHAWIAALVLFGCALVRAALEYRAGDLLHDAADRTIARERAQLIGREARSRADVGSAQIAALVVQKLPLLHPWITRYHVAMTRALVLPAFFVILAFSQSWVVGLVLLIAGPLIPVFMALVGMAAETASRKQMDEIGTMNDMVLDRLTAMLDIRLLGALDRTAIDFEARAEALRARTMSVLKIAFLSSTVLELFSALGVAMVAVFVGFTLLGEISFGYWGSEFSLAQGVFLLLIAPEFFQPLRELAAAWHDRAAGFAVVADLDALDAAERSDFVGKGSEAPAIAGPLAIRTSGAVAAIAERRFRLPDFTLRQGESLAFTGSSGVGKTTALAAIAGLVPVVQGDLFVCGQVLKDTNADAWRRRVSLVPQHPHFSNTPLGDWLDVEGTGRDPWSASALADADGVVRRLDAGLETRLGETGGGVSGGEARRLLLARAILSDADLILADEPTADLDDETAQRITAVLRQLQAKGHTIITATHDPNLASAMDRQLELQP